MTHKFKVGDRVSVVAGYQFGNNRDFGPHAGTVIVNIYDDTTVLVQLDRWTGGHGFRNNEWFFQPEQLEKLPVQLELPLATPAKATRLYPSDHIILKHLKKRRSISPMEALISHGCPRLAPRIFNLRKAGYNITTEICSDEPGHKYARYKLAA